MPVTMQSERARIPSQRDNVDDIKRPVSVLIAAPITTIWAAAVSFGPLLGLVLVVWAADTRSTVPISDAVRFAFNAWLLGHGAPLSIADARIGLIPLALTALICWRLWLAGTSTAKAVGARSWGALVRVAIATGLGYGGLAAAAAWQGTLPGARVSIWVAAVVGTAWGAGISFLAAARVSGHARLTWQRLPAVVRHGTRAGLAAALSLGAAGALLAGVSLIHRLALAADMFGAPTPGIVGGTGLLVLCAIYAPTIAIWGAAYLIGPGFAIGVDTAVAPSHVALGPVPAIPLFAGLPGDGGGAHLAVLVLPLMAGVVCGILLHSRFSHTQGWRGFAAIGVAAVATGLLIAAVAAASGGPLGGGRLAAVGPSAWRVGLLAAAWIAFGGLAAAATVRWLVPVVRAGWHVIFSRRRRDASVDPLGVGNEDGWRGSRANIGDQITPRDPRSDDEPAAG